MTSITELRALRRQLAQSNLDAPTTRKTREILELDWKIAAVPPEPLTGGDLADAMEADRMAIRDGYDPRMAA